MVINNELFRSWVNYLLFFLYVCVCLRCNLEIFPFLLFDFITRAALCVGCVGECVYLGVIKTVSIIHFI